MHFDTWFDYPQQFSGQFSEATQQLLLLLFKQYKESLEKDLGLLYICMCVYTTICITYNRQLRFLKTSRPTEPHFLAARCPDLTFVFTYAGPLSCISHSIMCTTEVTVKKQERKKNTSVIVFYYKTVLYYKEILNITNNTENNVTGIYSLGQSSLLNRHLQLTISLCNKIGNLKK